MGGKRAPWPLIVAAAFTLLFAAGRLLPVTQFFSSPASYLPMHITLEFAAIAVSGMVFALAWSLYRVTPSGRMFVLGLASLAVALLDLIHTLSFPGMPEFFTPSSTEKAIFYWFVARFIAAVGLLLAVVVDDQPRPVWKWYVGVAGALAVVAVSGYVGIHHLDALPDTFIEGQGLTTFKIVFEYVLAGLHALAAVGLLWCSRKEHKPELAWLAVAAWLLALAELFLTLYGVATDVFNLLGHLYKTSAYLLVYYSLFSVGVREPYARLDRESSLLRSLIDSLPDPISFKDREGVFAGANAAWFTISGLRPDDIRGRTSKDLAGRTRARLVTRKELDVPGSTFQRFEEHLIVEGAPEAIFDTLFVPHVGPDGETYGSIEVRRDITAAKAAEQRIEQLALYDQLTGLANPVLFEESLESLLAATTRGGKQVALVYLDLDDFRAINDSLGHAVGDVVLQECANRLFAMLPQGGISARLGADEYALAFPIGRLHEASVFVEQVRRVLAAPMHIDRHEFALSTSMGVAVAPVDGNTFDLLRRSADAALTKAKSEGHDTVRFFTQELQEQATRRMRLATALRRAIENEELRLVYQPQISAVDRRIIGVEALIRWEHPEYGLLPPAEFIPIAEDTGMILPIGDWVLETALRDAATWDAAGVPRYTMAVNLSAVQFRQLDLHERIARALERNAFPAERLDIEITETVAMRDTELAIDVVGKLHEIGVLFSIDDFGTGYSSLAYLKRFRVNRLKIDRSFVGDLGGNPENAAIVTAIIEVARALQCQTIAEGVELATQVEHLERMRCDILQGFYFSRPVPAAEMLLLLQTPNPLWTRES